MTGLVTPELVEPTLAARERHGAELGSGSGEPVNHPNS